MSHVVRAIHIYQMSKGRNVLFYTRQDYLVLFTVISVCAKKHGIRLLGLAIMYNHLHILIEECEPLSVSRFVADYSIKFAKLYNGELGCRGQVFHHPFGSALKYGEKNIRTAAGYLYNNHTNKKLCSRAEDIRWNFLAYAHNSNPFSEPLVLRRSSKSLRNAVKLVGLEHAAERPLSYSILRRAFKKLTPPEKEQLIDRIIVLYNIIDYASLEGLYRSYEDMLYSFNANTFNEYDISEEEEERKGDDRVYIRLSKETLSSGRFENLKEILLIPDDQRLRLAVELRASTGISYKCIGAFLHLRITRVKNVISGDEARLIDEAYGH